MKEKGRVCTGTLIGGHLYDLEGDYKCIYGCGC